MFDPFPYDSDRGTNILRTVCLCVNKGLLLASGS